MLVDSYGMCTIALDRRSAAAELGVRASSSVTLTTETAGPGDGAVRDHGVPIGLGRKEAPAVRRGTSLVLVALLVLILLASIIQFAFRL